MIWSKLDTMRAGDIARLPASERGGWEGQTSTGTCINGCGRPITRLDPDATDEERNGSGFFTCAPCRAKAKIDGDPGDGSYSSRKDTGKPNEYRDQGLCITCGAPAAEPDSYFIGPAARAHAEMVDSTVARMSTKKFCDGDCNPHRRPYCSECQRRCANSRKWRRAKPGFRMCSTCQKRNRGETPKPTCIKCGRSVAPSAGDRGGRPTDLCNGCATAECARIADMPRTGDRCKVCSRKMSGRPKSTCSTRCRVRLHRLAKGQMVPR